jgi:hypothetical protein
VSSDAESRMGRNREAGDLPLLLDLAELEIAN